jgi:hypothetical protein
LEKTATEVHGVEKEYNMVPADQSLDIEEAQQVGINKQDDDQNEVCNSGLLQMSFGTVAAAILAAIV